MIDLGTVKKSIFKIDGYKIGIFCCGDFGIDFYYFLKKFKIHIDFFGDNNIKKQGHVIDEIYCYSLSEIIKNFDVSKTVIIAAIKEPDGILSFLKQNGIPNAISRSEMLDLIEKLNLTKEDEEYEKNFDYTQQDVISELGHFRKKFHEMYQCGSYDGREPMEGSEFSRDLHNVLKNVNQNRNPKKQKMNVVQVNYTDLLGKIYNGYDLHIALNQKRYPSVQVVKDKKSNTDTVIQLKNDSLSDRMLKNIEKKYSMSNLVYPYGLQLRELPEFKNADIVHYHITHLEMISMLDLPLLMKEKSSVWTLHDQWLITGNCVFPCECTQWKTGCKNCKNYNYYSFEMKDNKAWMMWEIKKKIWAEINADIVVSTDVMIGLLKKSPLTCHLKRVHKIPFGINIDEFNLSDKYSVRKSYKIPEKSLVIGFRAEDNPRKGCKYIYEALSRMDQKENVFIVCIGYGKLPENMKEMFPSLEFGLVDERKDVIDFYKLCDIFIMPSLSETFGVMAIEAMAAKLAVICFKNTVVEEVSFSPECGIAVEYQSSEAILKAMVHLMENREEAKARGEKGRMLVEKFYRFEDYINKHIALYEEIHERHL